MSEIGVLSPEARVELLDGEIIDMSPIGPFHGVITAKLTEFFILQSKSRWSVMSQNSIRLDKQSQPQPDLILVKRALDAYTYRLPEPEDVVLLVEVSDSSIELDRARKLPLYGRAGIPEVWIVNLEDRAIEVYREPHLTGYASSEILKAGAKAAPMAFSDVMVDVAGLFKS